jgi:hypothetical protein
MTYIRYALDAAALEFLAIKLLHGCLKVRSGLEFDKTTAARVTSSFGVNNVETWLTSKVFQILPAGIGWKSSNLHSVGSTTGPRWRALLVAEATFALLASSRELDGQTFSHEVGTMKGWNDVARIHGILVFDEAKAIHELDLCNFSSAMGRKVGFDVGLGSIAREVPQVEPRSRDLGHGEVRFVMRVATEGSCVSA